MLAGRRWNDDRSIAANLLTRIIVVPPNLEMQPRPALQRACREMNVDRMAEESAFAERQIGLRLPVALAFNDAPAAA